ncbi:hypothetical protein NM208_g5491 [Fusarium decemcellulare]|uniref:Uncharacterized protein n=1 Tax=Fusarium decemcellulare TaxID=57161 RepID=A0ACC1SGW4_9HYPO|nr:hypothetical protein NM208_g5491 [Fusarium decemcellulare]
MQFSTSAILALLVASSHAWEITAYDNDKKCEANGETRYRVISGAPNDNKCFTFGEAMPGTSCIEFQKGGGTFGPCTGDNLVPRSIFQEASRCVVFDQPGCHGRFADQNGGRGCGNIEDHGWGTIKSFWCMGCKFLEQDTVPSGADF